MHKLIQYNLRISNIIFVSLLSSSHVAIHPDMNLAIAWYLVPFLAVFGVCFLFMAIFSVSSLSTVMLRLNARGVY